MTPAEMLDTHSGKENLYRLIGTKIHIGNGVYVEVLSICSRGLKQYAVTRCGDFSTEYIKKHAKQ